MKERVMVIGKGAREHALAYRLSRNADNKIVRDVLVCPGNDGIALSQACMRPRVNNFDGILELAKMLKPSLIVIGPEEPLAHGLADLLRAHDYCVFGPTQKAARVEASKSFMKDLATASQIPTAAFHTFSNEAAALSYVEGTPYPLVIKADGLCSGKGVVISHSYLEAREAIKTLMAMGPIVIEEFLGGFEMSVIALCTEDDARLFAPVRDHKRLCDGDRGPNTGGMGVVGPLPQAQDSQFISALKEKFFLPALAYMRQNGCPFRGALFAGLMVNGSDVRLLEFNARFGDPETQTLMFGCDVDLYPIMMAVAEGTSLSGYTEDYLMGMTPTATVTVATKGYPDAPVCGDLIRVSQFASELGMVFYAGASRNSQGQLLTDGGRILSCTARAESLGMAIRKSYDIVSHISFSGAHYRTDIGSTLLSGDMNAVV